MAMTTRWLDLHLSDLPSGMPMMTDCDADGGPWSRDRCASLSSSSEEDALAPGEPPLTPGGDPRSPYALSDRGSICQTPSPYLPDHHQPSLEDLDSVMLTVRDYNHMPSTPLTPVMKPGHTLDSLSSPMTTIPHNSPLKREMNVFTYPDIVPNPPLPHHLKPAVGPFLTSGMAAGQGIGPCGPGMQHTPANFCNQELSQLADFVLNSYNQGTLPLNLNDIVGDMDPSPTTKVPLPAGLDDVTSDLDDVFLDDMTPAKVKVECAEHPSATYPVGSMCDVKMEPQTSPIPQQKRPTRRPILSDQERRLRRRESNRRAARKCRNLKKLAQNQIAHDHTRLEQENDQLRGEVALLQKRNKKLEQVWNLHQKCCLQRDLRP